ncbi:MAG TPA: glycosyltransferase [Thermoanaerobaculia bacterium]
MRLFFTIVLLVWVSGLVRTIVNLLVVRRLRSGPREGPLVSILIPARDEERTIGRTVRAFLAQTYANLEVIVVNDRSTDTTGALLAAIDDPRLSVVDGEESPEGWLGKPWALHQASRRARGELLLFVDADVIYEPEAVAAAVAYFRGRDVGLLALFPRFEMEGVGELSVLPMLALSAFSVLPLWLSNRTRIALLAVGGGTGNLMKRADYESAGGHEALRAAVIDDVGMARLMRRAGHRTEAVRADALVRVRMYHGLRESVDGFTKNSFAMFGNVPTALFFTLAMVVLHLAPYLLAATGDAIGIATVIAIILTRVVLFAALGYPLWAALLLHPVMIAIWTWILLRSTWFSGVRRRVTWRGRTYDASRTRFGAD